MARPVVGPTRARLHSRTNLHNARIATILRSILDQSCLHRILSPILSYFTGVHITVKEGCSDWELRHRNVRGFQEMNRVFSEAPYSQWALPKCRYQDFANTVHEEIYCQIIKACRNNDVEALTLHEFRLEQPMREIRSDFLDCLRRLKSISLRIVELPEINGGTVGERLTDFLNALPGLEELSVGPSEDTGYPSPPVFVNGHLRSLQSKIKVLKLRETFFADRELMQILSRLRASLVHLDLHGVNIGPGLWSDSEKC